MTYTQIKKSKTKLLALKGLTATEFETLCVPFTKHWNRYISEFTLDGQKRTRRSGVKTTNVLPTVEDKLLFILSYLKTYQVQVVQAELFSLTQPQCNNRLHRLSRILGQALYDLRLLSERDRDQLAYRLKDYKIVFMDGPGASGCPSH